uniref:Uncharacterized protein n=1 Tax=Rhizophora mucronata TaxID=61149 RepID=A0A2P2INS8_RHIMU
MPRIYWWGVGCSSVVVPSPSYFIYRLRLSPFFPTYVKEPVPAFHCFIVALCKYLQLNSSVSHSASISRFSLSLSRKRLLLSTDDYLLRSSLCWSTNKKFLSCGPTFTRVIPPAER